MADSIKTFQEEHPSLESYWRSVILFGRNTASYKFALAKALLEHSQVNDAHIPLENMASVYADYMCQHLRVSPKQLTGPESLFIETCNQFIKGEVSRQKLIDIALKKGFRWVLDAFHQVNRSALPISFFSYSRRNGQLVLRDEFFRLFEKNDVGHLTNEVESRWNLVETAWELGVSSNLLRVQYDGGGSQLFVETGPNRRKDITSARDALSGYQKGKCFYCFDDISIQSGDDALCDVDHFFPHMLQPLIPEVNLDGVWNLVLACPNCNRGEGGKFEKIPTIKYLERLHKRNEFLISSHHPLRETLISQTGATTQNRVNFLQNMDHTAINCIVHRWEAEQIGEEVF